MHLTTFAILPSTTPHLQQSATSSFLKPILLMFPSTCFLHFILSQPCLHFHLLHVPFPLSKHLPQVVSKHDHTTSHHLPLPAYLLLFSIPMCPSAPLYSSCPPTLHCRLCVAFTIDLFALFKIVTSFFKKHQVFLPYNIANLGLPVIVIELMLLLKH